MLIDFRTLWPKWGIKPKGILHIGGNRAEEFPVYMELGVKKQVWYEANIEMYNLLIETIKDNPEATAFNLCVGDEFKEVILHIANNQGQSSSILELGTHKTVHPEVRYIKDILVQMVRLDCMPLDEDIDFLNIDIQGAELMALKGMGDLLYQFKAIYLEVNWRELYIGCALFDEVVDYLKKYDFEVAEYLQCGNTFWGDCLFINKVYTDKDGNAIEMPWYKL